MYEALLRSDNHKTEVFASFLNPRQLWQSLVLDPGIGLEEQTITWNGGAGANYAWIFPNQTVHVHRGTTYLGKVRVKTVSSGDAGITGTLVVGANSIPWAIGDTLTFLHIYELWAVFPKITTGDIFFKDWDLDGGINYTDENSAIRPVAIGGPNQAAFLSSGTVTINIPVGQSYSLSGGAITGTTVSAKPSVGVTVGALVGDDIPVTFTIADQYWLTITTFDSNGESYATHRCVFIHEDNQASSSYPNVDFQRVTARWTGSGWAADLIFNDNVALADIPSGTVAVIWKRSWYGGAQTETPNALTYGQNVIVSGYVSRDSVEWDQEVGDSASFSIVTVDEILKQHFMYSISLAADGSPDKWFKYLASLLTLGHYLEHLYRYHSTLLHICDVIGLDDDRGFFRKYFDIEKGNLYTMGNDVAWNQGIYARLLCDKTGRVRLVQDYSYRDQVARDAVPTLYEIEQEDVEPGAIGIEHSNRPSVSFVFFSGFYHDGTTGSPAPAGSTAPSTWPDPWGTRDMYVERQIIGSQAHSDQVAGQVFAKENNEFPNVSVSPFSGNYFGMLEPALLYYWELTLGGDTIRDINWGTKRMLLRQAQATFDVGTGVVTVSADYEPEVDGRDGVPYQWPEVQDLPIGGLPPDIPTSEVEAIMTAASAHYLPVGQTSWTLRTANAINDMQKTPYFAGIPFSSDPQDAILWEGSNGVIRKTEDAGQSWANITNMGAPPNDAVDSPAPTLGDLNFTVVEFSLILPSHIAFLGSWLNSSGAYRGWALSTTDDGSTWSWKYLG